MTITSDSDTESDEPALKEYTFEPDTDSEDDMTLFKEET